MVLGREASTHGSRLGQGHHDNGVRRAEQEGGGLLYYLGYYHNLVLGVFLFDCLHFYWEINH